MTNKENLNLSSLTKAEIFQLIILFIEILIGLLQLSDNKVDEPKETNINIEKVVILDNKGIIDTDKLIQLILEENQ